ncbi:GNAT family N-acetyltransferase [Planococcus sp. ISL-109]|uniref:GNAT family N-acetyltransferase n=1 Tax=Planococcus sp. ISL-109 TaxID=2819166 RepID=UPI001BEAAA13|nr:GNAT family N-acetyltransferase [Planococcus sp. ISL-109]MBT2581420.1 N-acetyltransferase [Planococcus sp. ISL-109]
MDFQHQDNRITLLDGPEELGFVSYQENGDVLTIDHTEVAPKLSGQGMGKQLVGKLVEHARNDGKSLDPQCPYAKTVIERTEEYQDVLAK